MLREIMYPKAGWIVVHVVTIIGLFFLGYSVHF
jgi:hypothetical protein